MSNYKIIPLTQGQETKVDSDDYDRLLTFGNWGASLYHSDSQKYRAVKNVKIGNNWKTLYMHRVILNAPSNMQVDHINGDGLDNRKCNLRLCTPADNNKNTEKRSRQSYTSIFKGVYWNRGKKKWHSQIKVEGKRLHLGYFTDEAQAAEAYNKAALQYFGEFAKINKI